MLEHDLLIDIKNSDDNIAENIDSYHKLEVALNVLKIIKDKMVNVFEDVHESDSYEEYLDFFNYAYNTGNHAAPKLTKDEYNLLKTWFGW